MVPIIDGFAVGASTASVALFDWLAVKVTYLEAHVSANTILARASKRQGRRQNTGLGMKQQQSLKVRLKSLPRAVLIHMLTP